MTGATVTDRHGAGPGEVVRLDIGYTAQSQSQAARQVVGEVRSVPPPPGATVLVSGITAVLVDECQWGHLSGLLSSTPTGSIDPTMPILLLAMVFGLSMDYMDYEVRGGSAERFPAGSWPTAASHTSGAPWRRSRS